LDKGLLVRGCGLGLGGVMMTGFCAVTTCGKCVVLVGGIGSCLLSQLRVKLGGGCELASCERRSDAFISGHFCRAAL
jgi:hypothetical protein